MADEVTTEEVSEETETTEEVVETEAPEDESTESETEDTQLEKDETDWKAESRKHEKQARANARELKQAQALAEKAGLSLDEESVEAFVGKLANAERIAREKTVELAVFKTAAANDADANALLDSRSFMEKVAALDPESDDFNSAVTQAITDAMESNPRLKVNARPAVKKTGPEMNGGTGKKRFTDAEIEAMSNEEFKANFKDIIAQNKMT